MPHKLRLAPIVLVVAIAAAGCGGSSSETPKQKLVAEADPICKKISLERTAANTQLTGVSSSTAKTLQVLARIAPPVATDEHQAIARLRSLKAPASINAEWQKLLAGMEELANDATQVGVHAKAHDYKAVVSVTDSGRTVRQQLTPLAAHLGFAYCGPTS